MALTPQSLQFIDGIASSFDFGRSITTDAFGNVYVCGFTNSGASGAFTFAGQTFYKPATNIFNAMFIGKIGANGVPLWLRMLDGIGSGDDSRANSISCANNGDVYVVGSTTATLGGPQLNFSICSTTPGGQTTTPYFKDPTTGQSIVLLKLDTNGTVGWLRILSGTTIFENSFSIKVKPNNSLVSFTGTSSTTGTPFQYTTCGTTSASSVSFAKPATINQSILIGQITANTGVCNWINLVDGTTAAVAEQGSSIAWENDYTGDLLITGFTSSTSGFPTTGTINFIQSTGPTFTSSSYTKVATTGQALFVLRLNVTGGFEWMNILDSNTPIAPFGSETGIGVAVGYDSISFDPKVYITGPVSTTSLIMRYSSVVPAGLPFTQPWNIPTVNQFATLIAKIDFYVPNLEELKFFDTGSGANPDFPTGIAVKSDLIDPTVVYICGFSTWAGGTLFLGTASDTGPATTQSYTIPFLNDDNSFILKLDESLNYLESKWIDRADPLSTGSYLLAGIALDTQDNIYVIGTTDQTAAGNVNFAGEVFSKPPTNSTSTFIGKFGPPIPQLNPICYAKGTLIATDRGFVPIEDIKLSDKVRTYDRITEKILKPVLGLPFKTLVKARDSEIKNIFTNIKFIGHFSISGMYGDSAPICITTGSLGKNQPEKDLFVSPNHSILIGERLVFAKDLINEISIYQDMSFETIEYYHILCDDHYIINANGALSETLGSKEIKLFETMIYAQSKVYEPLAFENKFQLEIK